MNILILGGGGREHAIAWKLSQSPSCRKIFIAPGNGGTGATGENTELDPMDFKAVANFAKKNNVDLIIPGPEAPIVKGIYDYFKQHDLLDNHPVLAPEKQAALLEGSKSAAKRFMHQYKIPTAAYATFTKDQYEDALNFIQNHSLPLVVKADGLAAGKGVVICNEEAEAKEALHGMLVDNQFGEAGSHVIIEEFLEGDEVSVFAITDGKRICTLPDARDYKRAGEGDTGLNTGGMGAISPSGIDAVFMKKVEERIIKPTLRGIEMEEWQYKGFLFFGLMNVQGNPFVLEYNVRLGDPETEVILPRMQVDFADLCLRAATGELGGGNVSIDPRVAATVILASGGYPGSYAKGLPIGGLDAVENSLVFHAGTKKENGKVVTSGGRVLALTALHKNPGDALKMVYNDIDHITFDGKYFRKDIGRGVIAV